jgi:hypothetical protein
MSEDNGRHVSCRLIKAGLTCLAMAGAAACCTVGPAYAADRSVAGYGPPSTQSLTAGIPGGYTSVITSVPIGPAGGTIGPLTVNGAMVTITIPAGAFSTTVLITVTQADLGGLTAAMPRYVVVAGVGIQVTVNGQPYAGTFLKPLTATIRSSQITASSVVQVWNGSAFVTDQDSSTAAGAATLSFDTDPYFVVQSPATQAVTAIPGATTSRTGEPLLGEGIAAGGLLLLGSGGLAVGGATRRRQRK